jgi:hypothetical protein
MTYFGSIVSQLINANWIDICLGDICPFSSLQSDVIHQSVYELIHSEDRVELQKQLSWLGSPASSNARINQHDSFLTGKGKILPASAVMSRKEHSFFL